MAICLPTTTPLETPMRPSLSLAERITLILYGDRSSKEREATLDLIGKILADDPGGRSLFHADVHQLLFLGFSESVAIRLQGIQECARHWITPIEDETMICSPGDAARLLFPLMCGLLQEQARVLVLDSKYHVRANILLYQGTVDTTVMRPVEALRPALARNCPAVFLAHNHPSGDCMPSSADITFTHKMAETARLLDIELVDHLVIGNGTYTSIRSRHPW